MIKLNVSSIPDGVQKMVNPLKHINTLESETYPLLKTIENQHHFSKFCDALKGIVLLDDNRVGLCTFWKNLDTALMTSLNSNIGLSNF